MEEWRGAPEQLSIDPDRLLAAISTAVPDPDELARHFTFDVWTFQIAMPESLPTSQLIDLGTQQEIIEARQLATVKPNCWIAPPPSIATVAMPATGWSKARRACAKPPPAYGT